MQPNQTHNECICPDSMFLDDEIGDAFATELQAAHAREAQLAKELGKLKAENAELQTKLQKVTASLKSAKVTAREALIEMADQNAKLVQAFVEKKRECKQLKVCNLSAASAPLLTAEKCQHGVRPGSC